MRQIFTIVALICAALPRVASPRRRNIIRSRGSDFRGCGKKLITVKHGDIPGLMPAMTMTYQIAEPRQIQTLQPGDKITADLVVSENKGRLEKIVLGPARGTGKPLRARRSGFRKKGDAVPDFALVNQDGKMIHFRNYRGKVLLVTFIYTRWPLPDFCRG